MPLPCARCELGVKQEGKKVHRKIINVINQKEALESFRFLNRSWNTMPYWLGSLAESLEMSIVSDIVSFLRDLSGENARG